MKWRLSGNTAALVTGKKANCFGTAPVFFMCARRKLGVQLVFGVENKNAHVYRITAAAVALTQLNTLFFRCFELFPICFHELHSSVQVQPYRTRAFALVPLDEFVQLERNCYLHPRCTPTYTPCLAYQTRKRIKATTTSNAQFTLRLEPPGLTAERSTLQRK